MLKFILGTTGTGKSRRGVDIGVRVLETNKDVLHIAIDTKASTVMEQYTTRLTENPEMEKYGSLEILSSLVTADAVFNLIKARAEDRKLGLVIIDTPNLLKFDENDGLTKLEQLENVYSRAKEISDSCEVDFILISQLGNNFEIYTEPTILLNKKIDTNIHIKYGDVEILRHKTVDGVRLIEMFNYNNDTQLFEKTPVNIDLGKVKFDFT